MSGAGDHFGDLSAAARGRGGAELSAGSLGYRHFLEQLAEFISPVEAEETQKKFWAGARLFWYVVAAYLLLYFGLNRTLGPWDVRAAAWGNEALRAGLFVMAVVLARRFGITVGAQMLLPLGSLCYLPMPVAAAPGSASGPLIFGAVVLVLAGVGWCVDASSERRGDAVDAGRRAMGYMAAGTFVVLNLVAWWWVEDRGAFPALSLVAAAAALPRFSFGGQRVSESTDVEFLYFAAWKRWRYFVSGRALAVILGTLPFLLFTSLLDYQEQLELCLHEKESPALVRMAGYSEGWRAFFWRQEGRFLSSTDFEEGKEESAVVRKIYLVSGSLPTAASDLPEECRAEAAAFKLPEDLNVGELRARMLALNGKRMTEEAFEEAAKEFSPLQITSRCRLLVRSLYPSSVDFVQVHFVRGAHAEGDGICFAEKMDLHEYEGKEVEELAEFFGAPKWIFFAFGIFGFVFLWRRGGDSALARWVGIWLIGASLAPLMAASDDTLPHLTQWLWEQSMMYRWNTVASAAQPLMNLLYIAATVVTLFWAAQVSQTVCWAYLCWPTRVHPELPPVVRRLLIVGKIVAVFMVNDVLFLTVIIASRLLFKGDHSSAEMAVCLVLSTGLLLVAGAVVRIFTAKESELPRIGVWPIVAMLSLNLALVCYIPGPMFLQGGTWVARATQAGTAFGCVFIAVMSYLILKRDFLRVRAIAGFTMLLLLLGIPLVVHLAEESVPAFLRSGPFFGERGAEMVTVMLVVLLFPIIHEKLHELLLSISVPRLRRIEHSVEHALEEIVDAPDDAARAAMVSELFEHLRVPAYLFLSRRGKGVFAVDINKLGTEVVKTIELSAGVRQFFGRRRHFVDLQAMAFEWPFFFYQFELYRMTKATGCRYLLPVSVGESLRGLLLLPDGPGEQVLSHPAMSENINNVGIAAALSRRVV